MNVPLKKQFNIHEAKTNFSRLVERAEQGEELVIGRAGKPVAKIVPLPKPKKQRKPGGLRGKMVIHDNFDDELPEEIMRAFRGEGD